MPCFSWAASLVVCVVGAGLSTLPTTASIKPEHDVNTPVAQQAIIAAAKELKNLFVVI